MAPRQQNNTSQKLIDTGTPGPDGSTVRKIDNIPALRSPASRPVSNRASPQDRPLEPLRDVTQNARNQLVGVLTGSPAAQTQQDQEASQEPPSKRSILPSSQDTSSLTETDNANDRKYDDGMNDDDETVRMSEKSRFADYPALLRTFLEMGSENAIPRLLTDINRLNLDRTQKLNLLRRFEPQLKNIDYHRETFPKLYDVAYENTTVGAIASSLKDYVNYFVDKVDNVPMVVLVPEWDDRAGSAFADVPRYEMHGATWADSLSKIIYKQLPLPAESEEDVQWYNIVLPDDYSDANILEAFRGKRKGKLQIKDLYEDIIDDALIHYLPNAVTFLLNRINKMGKKTPKNGIIDSALSLEDDMIQVKHYVNRILHEIRQPLPMRKNVTDKSPELKMEENVGKVFSLYPIINKLIGAYTRIDLGERQFLHPHVAWATEKNKNAEAIKVSRVLTEGTDLMSALDDLVNERVKKPVMTHENFLTVDETGLYIQDVNSRAFDTARNAINMISHFNLGRVGPAYQGYIKYADFTDRFNKNFNILHPPSPEEEAAVEEGKEEAAVEEGEEEVVSSLPEDPRQNKADLTMSESKLSSTTLDNSSTSSPSRLPNASQISDNTLQKYSKEYAGAGYLLKKLPPRPPEGNQGNDQAEESEISEIQINHVDPALVNQLNDEITLLRANNHELRQMMRGLVETNGSTIDDDSPHSLFNQLSALYSTRNEELAILRTELDTHRQKNSTHDQLIRRYKLLETQTRELQKLVTSAQDQQAKLENMLQERDNALAEKISENEALDHSLRDMQAFNEARGIEYGNHIDTLGKTIQELQKALEQKTGELSALRQQNNEANDETVQLLENDVQEYQDKLQAAHEQIAELEAAMANANVVAHSAADLQRIQGEIRNLRESAQNAKNEVQKIKEFNQKLQTLYNRARDLEITNHMLETSIEGVTATKDNMIQELHRAQAARRRAENELNTVQDNFEQYKNLYQVQPFIRPTTSIAETNTEAGGVTAETNTEAPLDASAEPADPNTKEPFTYEGHTVEVMSAWPLAAKQTLAVVSKHLVDSQDLLKQYMTKTTEMETEIASLQQSVEWANVRANANEEFAKELEAKYKSAPPSNDPVAQESGDLVPVNVDMMDNDMFNHLNDELTRVRSESDQIIVALRDENEGLTDINIRKDDELRAKDAEIRDLQQRLKAFNRKSVEKQTDLANAVMYESVEKLRDRSKSARRADSYRLRREVDVDYANAIYEIEKDKRERNHEQQKEIITLRAQLQEQKEANDRLHEVNKILHASGMELTKMNNTHTHEVGKMNLGASIYKDRQEHGVSLGLAEQGIKGDRAIRAKVVKNNEAGKLIARLAGSSDDAIRALGASMFANLLQDMTTLSDEELQAANAPELIKMYDDGIINNIITALATPRRAVDDSLAKRITDLEGTVRSFINMTAQRTAHVGTAQAYHPPRRVFMGRGPAGVGKSNVRAPRKGRAKSKPARKPKRGGRRSKK